MFNHNLFLSLTLSLSLKHLYQHINSLAPKEGLSINQVSLKKKKKELKSFILRRTPKRKHQTSNVFIEALQLKHNPCRAPLAYNMYHC